ncbi:TetR/AcrR family transcriptional regulator [Dactylosporangium sp. CA-092794]|uniref:TetR/AcrR family transcriptional regulator n=1 Tax=Dactylosporangium sp. CA-092794 TaxID=3239929 RepID=UPI003D9492E4
MVTRTESAAATRAALVRAAAQLLAEGGPEAVTLRAVGALAGVSRGAAYGHFEDKEALLTQIAVDGWTAVADALERLGADAGLSATERLEQALIAFIDVARHQPHLYAQMFRTPTGDPQAVVRAAERSQQAFLAIVRPVVGAEDVRAQGALLMSSAHGIAGMELSGHLAKEKWSVTGNELIVRLVAALRRA